jgi:hypothetical protein
MDPDGDFAGGLMAEVIDDGLQYPPRADLQAIAVYLASQPAVSHLAHKAGKKEKHGNSDF